MNHLLLQCLACYNQRTPLRRTLGQRQVGCEWLRQVRSVENLALRQLAHQHRDNHIQLVDVLQKSDGATGRLAGCLRQIVVSFRVIQLQRLDATCVVWGKGAELKKRDRALLRQREPGGPLFCRMAQTAHPSCSSSARLRCWRRLLETLSCWRVVQPDL